jgi:hypothetical protein
MMPSRALGMTASMVKVGDRAPSIGQTKRKPSYLSGSWDLVRMTIGMHFGQPRIRVYARFVLCLVLVLVPKTQTVLLVCCGSLR